MDTRRKSAKSSIKISRVFGAYTCFRRRHAGIRWFESPISEKGQLYRHSDATPMELFFDLFFVANLSTFTASHEINNVEGLSCASGQMALRDEALTFWL